MRPPAVVDQPSILDIAVEGVLPAQNQPVSPETRQGS